MQHLRTPFVLLVAFYFLSCTATSQTQVEAPASEHTASVSVADGPEIGETMTQRIPGTTVSHTLTYIPGGSYVIGSPDSEAGREDDEGPQKTITVEPFWMGIYEVTHEEYDIFRNKEQDSDSTFSELAPFDVDAAVRPSPPYEDPAFGMPKGKHPAVGITQWGALQYARWLYEKTGHYYRLPTEAEWEYACRAGSETAYSFGDDPDGLDAVAWFWDNSGEEYHAVGSKEPNNWGLYDMHGNVAEWTLDEYAADYYSSFEEGETSPWAEPTALHPRTVRGGAYDDDADALRCASRLQSSLAWKRRDPQLPKSFWWNTDSPFVGFRLIRPVNPPAPEEIDEFFMLTLGE